MRFGIETVTVDMALPDAYALATCIHAEHRGWTDVKLASFDNDVLAAHANLHPNP